MSFATSDPSDFMTVPPASDSVPAIGHQGLRLHVRHLTRFDYLGPVQDSVNDARLCPVSDPLQHCESFSLRLSPPAPVHTYYDFYLNRVDHFEVHHPHEFLEVEAFSVVTTRPDPRGPVNRAFPPSLLLDADLTENYFDFVEESQFVTKDPVAWRESMDVLPNGVTDLWEDAVTLGRHVFRNFTYLPRVSHANTRVIEVLETRRGVCQDFAHVMLSLCRCQGIPARYVSGYFYDETRHSDEPEASHAWVEIFLPGYGWKGFDPTHDRPSDTRYIKLAVGRDYADIRPLNGLYRGRGSRQMSVMVQVRLAPPEGEV